MGEKQKFNLAFFLPLFLFFLVYCSEIIFNWFSINFSVILRMYYYGILVIIALLTALFFSVNLKKRVPDKKNYFKEAGIYGIFLILTYGLIWIIQYGFNNYSAKLSSQITATNQLPIAISIGRTTLNPTVGLFIFFVIFTIIIFGFSFTLKKSTAEIVKS